MLSQCGTTKERNTTSKARQAGIPQTYVGKRLSANIGEHGSQHFCHQETLIHGNTRWQGADMVPIQVREALPCIVDAAQVAIVFAVAIGRGVTVASNFLP